MLSVAASMVCSNRRPLSNGTFPLKCRHKDADDDGRPLWLQAVGRFLCGVQDVRTGFGILKLAAAGAMPLRSLNWSPKLATMVKPPSSCSKGLGIKRSRTAGLCGTWRILRNPHPNTSERSAS